MPIVAAGVSFSGSENARRELFSPTQSLMEYGCHCRHCSRCGGRDGQSHRHDEEGGVSSSERRVRGEDDKDPHHQDCCLDLPLDVLRNMDIRVDPWSAPTCAPPNALRIRPAHARTSGADVSRSDVRSYEGLGPCRRHRIATRARICSADFDTYACGGFEDSAKIAKHWDEWYLSPPPHRVGELVRLASTHRYLSFDPVTEHIVSEMGLVLRSDKGKGWGVVPSLLRLAVRCLSPACSPARSRMAWHGAASTAADPEARRGPACVLSAGPTHRLPFRRRRGRAA
jgi:hypothetical protein